MLGLGESVHLNFATVRAPEDVQALAEDESYEGFHPSFTYPVSSHLYVWPNPEPFELNGPDLRRRRENIWIQRPHY